MTYPSNSPLLKNDTKRRLINIGRLDLVLKSKTWFGYYVGIFQQLDHATNFITNNWVCSASLTKSTPSLSVLLFHHTIEFTISSTHYLFSSTIHPQSREEASSHPPYGIGNRDEYEVETILDSHKDPQKL